MKGVQHEQQKLLRIVLFEALEHFFSLADCILESGRDDDILLGCQNGIDEFCVGFYKFALGTDRICLIYFEKIFL